MENNRREFIKKSTLALGGLALGLSPRSYAKVLGANDRMLTAHAGLNSRMNAHLAALKKFSSRVEVLALCDVDNRTYAKTKQRWKGFVPEGALEIEDYRKLLENKDIDIITVASPDHWHTPMGIMAMQAGKHVYLEKPCSHNPQESLWLEECQKKTGKVLQIGNQQRSAPTSIDLVKKINEGVLGEVYYAKTFYESWRGSIGVGKMAAVPDWLNWDLFQGPAPRRAFTDNVVHYNWHWFRTWGTGEVANNGLHEMDIARWALGVDIPEEVSSSGGRFAFQDDWEFYDTQNVTYKFPGNKIINWEGRSCNGSASFRDGKGRGTYLYGTKATAYVDRGGYIITDKAGKTLHEMKEGEEIDGTNTLGISGLDNFHMHNFLNAISDGEELNSPVGEAVKSTLLCHLGNMSQRTGKTLKIDTVTGKPKDKDAMKDWSRSYENGWRPVV